MLLKYSYSKNNFLNINFITRLQLENRSYVTSKISIDPFYHNYFAPDVDNIRYTQFQQNSICFTNKIKWLHSIQQWHVVT